MSRRAYKGVQRWLMTAVSVLQTTVSWKGFKCSTRKEEGHVAHVGMRFRVEHHREAPAGGNLQLQLQRPLYAYQMILHGAATRQIVQLD